MTDWVTILTFTYAHELVVAQGLLESEGIVTYAKDEYVATVNPFYSNAIGGVKLQVQKSDAAHAISILKEAGFIDEPKGNSEF
jgi:hypothetical protein